MLNFVLTRIKIQLRQNDSKRRGNASHQSDTVDACSVRMPAARPPDDIDGYGPKNLQTKRRDDGTVPEGLGGRRRPVTLPSALFENSEWMVVAIAAAVLVIVGVVSLAVFSRKVSRLAKNVEKLAQEVNELRNSEERHILKDLRSQHSPGEKIQAPPLAHF